MRYKMRDKIKVKGRCRFIIRNAETGTLIETSPWNPNLVTDDGEELYAQLMRGDAVDPCSYCAVGDDNTPAAEADTALISEIGRLEITDATIAGSVVTYSTFFGSGDSNGNWWEVGLLNAAVAGVLIARTVLGGVQVKNAANTITVEYELSVV